MDDRLEHTGDFKMGKAQKQTFKLHHAFLRTTGQLVPEERPRVTMDDLWAEEERLKKKNKKKKTAAGGINWGAMEMNLMESDMIRDAVRHEYGMRDEEEECRPRLPLRSQRKDDVPQPERTQDTCSVSAQDRPLQDVQSAAGQTQEEDQTVSSKSACDQLDGKVPAQPRESPPDALVKLREKKKVLSETQKRGKVLAEKLVEEIKAMESFRSETKTKEDLKKELEKEQNSFKKELTAVRNSFNLQTEEIKGLKDLIPKDGSQKELTIKGNKNWQDKN